jgi:hypothetical protein
MIGNPAANNAAINIHNAKSDHDDESPAKPNSSSDV